MRNPYSLASGRLPCGCTTTPHGKAVRCRTHEKQYRVTQLLLCITIFFFVVSVVVAGIFLVLFFPHAAQGDTMSTAETAPATACVPFAETRAPQNDDPVWKQIGMEEKISVVSGTETTAVWSFIRYEHREKKGLALGAHYFFGKLGMFTWGCAESGIDQTTGETKDLRATILRCGIWSATFLSRAPVGVRLWPDAANPALVTLTLLDDRKNAIVASFERR